MKLGLGLFATEQVADIRDVARAAEDLGFESLFVAEHTHIPTSRRTPYPMGGDLPPQYAMTYDPFIALTAAAMVTTTLRLGTGVCLVVERDPVILAKEVATLDRLSGGRLMLGVGAGWNAEEMATHNVAFDSRWEVLRERVELMQALWTQDVASYDGQHASLEPSWQWPKPVQSPFPVMVGGSGPRSMRHAVHYGTDWMPMPSTAKLGDRLAELAAVADKAGRPVPSVTMYAVRPDAAVIDHYAEFGVERCVFVLPLSGDLIAAVRNLSSLVGR